MLFVDESINYLQNLGSQVQSAGPVTSNLKLNKGDKNQKRRTLLQLREHSNDLSSEKGGVPERRM